MTRVDPRLHPLAAFDIPFPGRQSLQLGFELQQYRLREAVRQMKCDVLRRLRTFKVRQIAAAVPYRPGNANLPIGGFPPANREIGVPGVAL
jgi:hypothetical protein